MTIFRYATKGVSLHRDEEEDLIDCDDADIDIETGDHHRDPTAAAIEDAQLDVYSDDIVHSKDTARKTAPKHEAQEEGPKESNKQNICTDVQGTVLPAAKTQQAAALIKSLQEHLANLAFQLALGLTEPSNTVVLNFWANGFDFALTLSLVGIAKITACRFSASCYTANCTLYHSSADRIAVVAATKPRKLCTQINTPLGCHNGDACWYLHEACGMACAHGKLCATSPKGMWCFYKHKDDKISITDDLSTQSLEVTEATTEPFTAVVEPKTPATASASADLSELT